LKRLSVFLACLISLPATAEQQNPAAAPELRDCRISAGRGFPGIKARCGDFMRHENPDDPASKLLSLKFAVVPALSLEPQPDAFVPIAGGPGDSSIRFYSAYAGAFEKVRRQHDILLLDQRGTGESARMQCEMDEDTLDGRYSSEQTLADTQKCLDQLPHDPRFFTTSAAVRDLEALREVLGYSSLNLYGVSYGSRVAQHFLRQHPDSTRTVILDGVVPPQRALGPAIATEAQKVLDAIFDRCAENAACNEKFPDVRQQFVDLESRLADAPVELTVANPLTGVREEVSFGDMELAGAIRLLSYHPNTVALLPLLIDQAAAENFEPLASQFLMISESMSDALSLGMHNAVVCTEDFPFFAGEDISRDELEATYIGAVQLDALRDMCSIWPQGLLDEGFKTAVTTDIPVLVLSGEADPVTPPHFADLAAVEFANTRHITGRKQGHGQAPRGCMPDVIGRFVEHASIEDLGEDCFERVFAMPFFLTFAGPSP
jgi:pimeloyl-ACP methyl ester carboxylesterase